MASLSSNSGRDRSHAVGILMAAAVIPRTFQQSLMPRSTVDQGLITGVTMAMVYVMGLLVQDGVNATSNLLSNAPNEAEKNDINIKSSLILGLATTGIGLLLEKRFPYNSDEAAKKSAARTGGYWLKNIGIAGSIIAGIELINQTIDREEANKRDLMPYFISVGIIYSLVGEYVRTRSENSTATLASTFIEKRPVRAIAIGGGVAAALASVAYIERYIAKSVDKTLAKRMPNLEKSWVPIGHVVAAGALAYGASKYLKSVYAKIEHGADDIEIGFSKAPTSPYVSGSIASNVDWDTISVQGRRHICERLSATQIENIMGSKATEPIRIFVGLDSGKDEEERVSKALKELERTGAYERETILVASPTGTGYINYVMSEAVEYLAKGNVASVTIQYSKRPSPLSLDRVSEGHVQFRMLLNGIHKKLKKIPKTKRPRIVLFGESLGAWTSQDALMHSGTDGLEALDIERALWIGTPKGSKWKTEVLSKKMLNVEQELVGVYDNYREVLSLTPAERAKVRYVMVTHYNDPIAQFGLELLVKQPEWINNPAKRPKGLSSHIKYRTPAMFVQMLVDMKNALKPIPGKFVASGHDYRGDLAQFVAYVYNFKASTEQLEKIETALMRNEIKRAKLIEKGKLTTK